MGDGTNDHAFTVALDSSENIYYAGLLFSGSWSDMALVKVNSQPKILINSPNQNEYYKITIPNFDISILESDINTTWYTLDFVFDW